MKSTMIPVAAASLFLGCAAVPAQAQHDSGTAGVEQVAGVWRGHSVCRTVRVTTRSTFIASRLFRKNPGPISFQETRLWAAKKK
jgi:hypothetical protein